MLYLTVRFSAMHAVQYSAVQFSEVLCNTVQYFAVQFSILHYTTLLCSVVLYTGVFFTIHCSNLHYSSVLCSSVQGSGLMYYALCSSVQYSALQCSTLQYSEMQWITFDFSSAVASHPRHGSDQSTLKWFIKLPSQLPAQLGGEANATRIHLIL